MRLTLKTVGAAIKAGNAGSNQCDDPKGIPLDLNTVKRTSEAPPRTRSRIFGLKEAPTFYPTEEEFQDPIKYIQKIRPEGEKFGIVKIVPPKSYKPEFALNTEEFRFRTRVQKLNNMEGEIRANVNYLEELHKFHRLHRHPVTKLPQLDKRPIDLFRLKKEVAQRGGYQKVTAQKKWAEIGRFLGYTRKQCTSLSNALKSAYSRVILPYEVWLTQHKQDTSARISSSTAESGRTLNGGKMQQPSKDSPMAIDSIMSLPTTTAEPSEISNDIGSQACEVCHCGDNENEILLCDGCDRGYHLYCLSPPLTAVPKSDWFCVKCLTSAGRDDSHEDRPLYSLYDFQKLCDRFKTDWFANKADPPTEEDCEDEFWRLVDNPHETCEPEYGTDLHSTQHGSGFDAIERAPGNHSSGDLWNLNVLPVLPNSLFTHIKTDISSMMAPWLYVGMCFSAFCWRNENHYTYSISYLHWGETKTWYGVPGRYASKFEDAMRSAVPELFEQHPHLLFELATMLTPGRLLENNVEVYAVDQRPGQFVVTFPKAYHSGFNHGFNFSEAVNFAPCDWIKHDLECVKLYQKYRRQPCFSHDELLVTAARDESSTEDTQWLQEALTEMQQREITSRNKFARHYPKTRQLIEDVELHEDQQQCIYCNCYVYLSRVICSCTTRASCLEHATELCTCNMSKKTLCCRFTDAQLENMVHSITFRTFDPNAWITKVQQTLRAQPAPSLKILERLLSEAAHPSAPVAEAQWLRDYVDHVTAWIDEANKYLIPATRRATQGPDDCTGEGYRRIRELLNDAKKIAFDAPELGALQNTYNTLTQWRQAAERVLRNPLSSTKDFNDVYQLGIAYGSDLPEVEALKKAIEKQDWIETARRALDNPKTAYNTIIDLVKTAQELDVSGGDPVYVSLQEKKKQCELWIDRVETIVERWRNGPIAASAIRAVLDERHHLPPVPSMQVKVDALATHTADSAKEVESMLQRVQALARLNDRPPVREAQQILKRVSALPIAMEGTEELQSEVAKVDAWTARARRLFGVARSGTKSFEAILDGLLENVVPIITASLENRNDVYCICRTVESGLMIECDQCHEWYHGPCVKVSRRDAKTHSSYVCPVCNPNCDVLGKDRIELAVLDELVQGADHLRLLPRSYTELAELTRHMKTYQRAIRAFCQSKMYLGPDDLVRARQYLREIEGLDVAIPEETNLLRQKLQTASSMSTSLPPRRLTSASPSSLPATAFSAVTIQSASPWASRTSGGPLPGRAHCVCRRTLNVSDASSQMIGCDACHGWFHIECVNLTPIMVLSIDQFLCPDCIAIKRRNQPPAPKRIIKLTVKPPAPPSPSRTTPPSSSPTPPALTLTSSSSPKKRKHHHDGHTTSRTDKDRINFSVKKTKLDFFGKN
ncbi:PLU-1-like protein-domain-containing protein [Dichotomocladium elegans]|nr:PLU-1-like protein-domain-containing protein [Dichotomocladium elegans]